MNQTGQQWASALFKPVVLVVGSEKAQSICRKNNLDFAEMLKPFGDNLGEGDGVVRFRTPNQGLKVVRGYGVQMISSAEMEATATGRIPPLEQILINEPVERRKSDDIYELADAERFFRKNPDPTPWFTEYRLHMHRFLGFAQQEFTEQPIGMIIAVASDEDTPGKILASMGSQQNLPRPLSQGLLDSGFPCAYWVLHDRHGGVPDEQIRVTFSEVQARYGSKCTLVSINSATEDSKEELPDLWAPFLTFKQSSSDAKTPARGQFLSSGDRKLLSATVSDFIIKTLNPTLERKLGSLNQEVNAQRKGLGNTLKFMFSGKRSKSGKSSSSYDLKSLESKIRQAADYALLMQDYETAQSHYRIAKQDYAHDKKHRLMASANEMHGLCAVLSGTARGGQSYIDSAAQWYQSNADIARATRAVLWAVDAYRSQGLPNVAASLLKRASERESHRTGGSQLRAALLIEQAAYMYLRPGIAGIQVRKYAFHLIMAGHMYHKCRLHWHGVRCYRSARCVLRGKRWFHAQDHIDYDLAKHLVSLREYETALHYFASSLNFEVTPNPFVVGLSNSKDIDDHSAADEKMRLKNVKQLVKFSRVGPYQQQPRERQDIFLGELKSLVDIMKKPTNVPNLNLPVIDDSLVKVSLSSGQSLAPEIAKIAWSAILFSNIPVSNDPNITNQPLFDEAQAIQKAKAEDRHVVVGEPVQVTMIMENPLHSPLPVTKIRLLCGLSIDGGKPVESKAGVLEDDLFSMTDAKLTLAPKSRSTCTLKVVCKRKGTLYISGVEGLLFNNMRVTHRFELPPHRRIKTTTTGRKRASDQVNQSLSVQVWSAAALLRCETPDFPETMLHSEIKTGRFTLRNEGMKPVPAGTIQVKVSHPALILFTTNDGNDMFDYNLKSGLVNLPFGIGTNETVELKCWIRAATLGEQRISILARYGYKNEEDKLEYRIMQKIQLLRVKPLMMMDIYSRPSIRFSEMDSSLLMSMIQNQTAVRAKGQDISTSTSSVTIQLTQAIMISDDFVISSCHSEPSTNLHLKPVESFNLVLRVQVSDNENKVASANESDQYAKGKQFSRHIFTARNDSECKLDRALWKLLGMERVLDDVELKRKIMLNPNAYKDYDVKNGSQKTFDLMINWEQIQPAEGETKEGKLAVGYHLLRNQKCLQSLYAKNMSACPLKVMVRHPQNVTHNFSTKGRLRIPVAIRVVNRRDDIAVSFVFETLPPTQEFDSVSRSFRESRSHSMTGRYFWSGKTTQRVQKLGPNQQVELRIDAMFHAEGEYNLNRFRFSVDMPNVGIKHFFFPLQHLISVK
eukprot:CAMPEP_0114509028 /NCGR_PEP_ID=MMETSP0109-20121206/12969_1 /TAXON_ID=29199 /ORGANISM="Chlorarachnion reptans, Strain CCCM449" /LENGTH=1300 /DNA_ID=CAMNT_0001688109 /DNA_START=61 /DNA_END=3960 /DNA_ORIENTATION=-